MTSWRLIQYEQKKAGLFLSFYPLTPPYKSLFLKKSPVASFLERHHSGVAAVDELYHENSKLSPTKAAFENIAGSLEALDEEASRLERGMVESVRDFVHLGGMFTHVDSLPETVRWTIQTAKRTLPPYAGCYVILREAHHTSVYRFIRPHYLLLTKRQPTEFIRQFEENSLLPKGGNGERLFAAIVVLYANHLLAQMTFGTRGYRVLNIECGKVLHALEQEGEVSGHKCISTVIFWDDAMNSLVGLDGRVCSVHGLLFVEE